jgi:murein DD-endopeptidase MepM/ murein hydrolase activator NlpD
VDRFPIPEQEDYLYSRGYAPREHNGVDIFAARGTPVVAVENGKARGAEDPKGGHVLYLYSQDGRSTYYYAHLAARTAALDRAGDDGLQVRAGEMLGGIGTTGNAAGGKPHLHFEILRGGKNVDPYPELRAVDPKALPDLGTTPSVPPIPEDDGDASPDHAANQAVDNEAVGTGLLVLAILYFLLKGRSRA